MGKRPKLDGYVLLVAHRVPPTKRRPPTEVPCDTHPITPSRYFVDDEPGSLQHHTQPSWSESSVVVHAEHRELVDLDHEGRGDHETSTRSAEIVEVPRSEKRIVDVFEDLFTEDHVKTERCGDRIE